MKRLFGKRGHHLWDPQEVLYLTGNINYCYLHLISGEVILTCRTLKWFSNQWPTFLRVHRNALINLSHVHHYQLSEKSTLPSHVVMADNARIEIARRRAETVSQLLKQLLVQAA